MKNETILLIGAAGNNGQATLNALHPLKGEHLRIRAAVRNEARAQELEAKYPGIETVVVDLDQPASLAPAFTGVNRVFMIPGNVENRAQHAKYAVDAAKAVGTVKQFLLYSVVGAEWEAILFARQFREAEKYLEASGLPWTHLRTIWFQENFLNWATGIKQGAFYFGIREGRFAPLNVQDIGAIAARVLTTDGHERKAYNITGPELLSGHDMAAIFSRVIGRPVGYVSPQATSTYDALIEDGWPEWQARGVLELFEVFASDQAAVISPDGASLLGRPLTRFEDFVQQHKSTFI